MSEVIESGNPYAGFSGLLKFCKFLRDRRRPFRIEQLQEDAIQVSFAMVGLRIEVDFFEDYVLHCIFRGSEDVSPATQKLIDEIEAQLAE